jgi:hypothetical protein
MQKAAWIALCVFLRGSCSLVAAPDVAFFGRTVNPLLYVVSAESFDFGEHWTKRQVYIFRDGTVLSAPVREVYSSPLPLGGEVFSGKVSADQMRSLLLAMAEVKVGLQRDCSIDPPDSPLEWYFEFSWFGAGKRKNTFKATEGPGIPCPPATEALIDAVTGTVNAAYQARTTALAVP